MLTTSSLAVPEVVVSATIGSDNGLSPVWRQVIICTNAGIDGNQWGQS